MPVTREMLVSELQALLRLTAVEQTIATVRRAQARTTSLERELRDNAAKAAERAGLLSEAIRRSGGVPDVVGSALGKASGFATTQLNQVQTLQGALLGDLALEHQLRERTRYARTLASSLGETAVLPVLDRLETAHTATIEWLEQRLAETARTGTSLLKATPLQSAVGTVRRLATTPLTTAADAVNQASALIARLGGKAVTEVEEVAGEAAQAAGSATEAVREAAGQAGEALGAAAGAVRETAGDAVDAVQDAGEQVAEAAHETAHETVAELAEDAKEAAAELTGVDLDGAGAVAHPFAGYEKLSGDRVMAHVRDTEDVAELRQILAFETANKARKGVLAEVGERLEQLSVDA